MNNSHNIQFNFDPERHTLSIQGELSTATAMQALVRGRMLFNETSEKVFINLSGIHHCDSSALAVMLDWLRFAQQKKKALHFVDIPQQLMAVAIFCGVDSLLKNNNK